MKLSTLKLPTRNKKSRRKFAVVAKHELKAQNLIEQSKHDEILDELYELFDSTYEVVRPGPWKRTLRPSGLPYCSVLDAMSAEEQLDYAKSFYLDIGTTVHELMQEYISRSTKGRISIYANWKCKDCGHLHFFSTMPFRCYGCGADSDRLHYEELEFENFRGLKGGHLDILIKTKYGWIVGDWKTASTTGLDYRSEADGKHHHQLQSYCLALEELFKDNLQGLPILGYLLIFVPRDSSGNKKAGGLITTNWTPYLYDWNRELAKTTKKRLWLQAVAFEAANIGFETGNWYPAALMRPCASLADFGMPMGMHDGFYGGEICPNISTCSRTNSDVVEMIKTTRIAIAEHEKFEKHKLELETKAFVEAITQYDNRNDWITIYDKWHKIDVDSDHFDYTMMEEREAFVLSVEQAKKAQKS